LTTGHSTLFDLVVSILVSAHKLEKAFASRTLFRGLTFAINSGDRIGLIGPNGAGKSTLLKIIAGQMALGGGELSLSRSLVIAFLEQSPVFTEGATVYETLLEGTTDHYDPLELARVDEFLSKLELDEGEVSAESLVGSLSGGWRKRVALGRELVRKPDLLLLDEPTNHLDVEGILWLEEFLSSARFATVTITHDRVFLQRVSSRIFDLDPRYPDGLLTVSGPYLTYLETRDELLRGQQRREDTLSNTLRRETEWLRRGAKARTTKQKARIDRAGDLKGEVEDLHGRNLSRQVQIEFSEAERNPHKLIEAKHLRKVYGDRVLFDDVNLLLTPKTRLGLLGSNGCGKSTLIRLLLGREKPDSGEVKLAERIEVAYFEQNRETLDPKKSLIRNVCDEGDYVNFRGQFIFARSYLDRFLFRKEQHDLPVEKLSGGEQARLRIAQMMLQPANVLVLDEPTNDLDMQTMNVLEDVLSEFNGAVILVTHDRYFLDQVSNRLIAFGLDDVGQPELQEFANYEQWENWFEARPKGKKAKAAAAAVMMQAQAQARAKLSSTPPSQGSIKSTMASTAPATLQTAPKPKRKLGFNEKRELDTMEANIQVAEAKLLELQAETIKPENLALAAKLTELYAEIGSTQALIEKLYSRWAELES
jgi:ATP-binding cassette subfamily F protein uup